jgi:hypothetical protein
MKRVPIVWIELGRKIPPHLRANIELHKSMFPHLEQILITDQKVPSKLNKLCKVINSGELQSFISKDELESSINRSTQQRDFWINTTRRFLFLEAFVKKSGILELVHLESDNVLLDLTSLDSVFDGSGWGLAYPMQAKGIGCASILFLNGLETIHEFNTLAINSWNEKDQDDMKLLGLFAQNSRVRVLNSFPEAKFVFDPQTFGRYLLGTDARNMRLPFSRRGIQDERMGALDVSGEISFTYNETNRTIMVKRKEAESQLANIHIHSKRVPKSPVRLFGMIAEDIERMPSNNWSRGPLDLRVFIERLASWAFRTFLRRRKEVRLR